MIVNDINDDDYAVQERSCGCAVSSPAIRVVRRRRRRRCGRRPPLNSIRRCAPTAAICGTISRRRPTKSNVSVPTQLNNLFIIFKI